MKPIEDAVSPLLIEMFQKTYPEEFLRIRRSLDDASRAHTSALAEEVGPALADALADANGRAHGTLFRAPSRPVPTPPDFPGPRPPDVKWEGATTAFHTCRSAERVYVDSNRRCIVRVAEAESNILRAGLGSGRFFALTYEPPASAKRWIFWWSEATVALKTAFIPFSQLQNVTSADVRAEMIVPAPCTYLKTASFAPGAVGTYADLSLLVQDAHHASAAHARVFSNAAAYGATEATGLGPQVVLETRLTLEHGAPFVLATVQLDLVAFRMLNQGVTPDDGFAGLAFVEPEIQLVEREWAPEAIGNGPIQLTWMGCRIR